MKPDPFVRAANARDLAGPGPFALSAGGVDIAVVRRGTGWRAFEGRCPHQGALLGEGEIEGGSLVCRNHRWRFSLDSGQRDGGPECLASCPAIERDGAVFVDVSALKGAPRRTAPTRSLDELPGPNALPLIGNLHQIDATKAHLVMQGWAEKYGPIYQIRMGARRVVVTSDPRLINEALRARPETFRRSANMDAIISEIGIKGVFNAEGDAWRPQRKLSVAALAQRHLRQLYPCIRTVAGRLKERWRRSAETGEPLDIVDELKRFTVDVTMLVAFGHDVNTVEQAGDVIQDELEIILPVVNRRLFAPFPLWRFVELPSDRRLNRALKNVRAWLGGLVDEGRARLEAEPDRALKPANFLEAMIAAVDEDGRPFADDVIMSNLLTMLLAGEDTTAYTLAWAVHQLCDSPEWAGEIRREADEVQGSTPVAEDLDIANRLIRANAVAFETMRLRPVAPVGLLDANVDAALGDFVIPKGATVAVLLRPAAIDEKHFKEPHAFRPERWIEDGVQPHDAATHIPFGSGPRMCPGRSLALLEMKTLLAMLYKSFDVERIGGAGDVKERLGFTMSPTGLKVRLQSRSGIAH
jgi:cytochrome P450/nitrite reductase/ring-hydroxylating ferredoxin subunit